MKPRRDWHTILGAWVLCLFSGAYILFMPSAEFATWGAGLGMGLGGMWLLNYYQFGTEDDLRRISELRRSLEREARFQNAEANWLDSERDEQLRRTDPGALPPLQDVLPPPAGRYRER